MKLFSKAPQTICAAFIIFSVITIARAADPKVVWLDELELTSMSQGWGRPRAKQAVTGVPLSIGGSRFGRGVGTHANSTYKINVRSAYRFIATVGLDDGARGAGSVVFQVLADGVVVFDSGDMRSNAAAKSIDLNLRRVQQLVLKVTDSGDGNRFDHADWADARFLVRGAAPVPAMAKMERPYILTPKPKPAPRINGPKLYGARPGHPFLYRIPTQGERPMTFSVDGLPQGFALDPVHGIIAGTTPPRGDYKMVLHAVNRRGNAQREFKLVSGDKLSLTPSMGFNDWYACYDDVTDQSMRYAAERLVSSGMADVGYEFVNIDDCWMNAEQNKDAVRNGPFRDARGKLVPNKYFPDMKGLADYVHSKGLKAGLYTSPGPKTCGGFAGALGHEAEDAKLFADWGFDFLKYDWCSYKLVASNPPTLEQLKAPYTLMGSRLKEQNRDFVYNLCQYGMGEVWKWGSDVGGHSWRTAGDLGFELNNIFEVALRNCEHRDWQKPGAWNDPDYLQIGFIGGAHGPVPCPLSPTEQYSFMSLWCLMASPLFYSGDMAKLDDFTLNVLCNPEVIEVDQDPLGECASVIKLDDARFLMIKHMDDGSLTVGLGNRGEATEKVCLTWPQLGLTGKQRVRDLWRQKDLRKASDKLEMTVRPRGVLLLRLWPVQ